MENFQIKLDFRSKKSLAEQVQIEMRTLIEHGVLRPGDQLPTVRMLAAQLRINFNTVARAYRVLDQQGWITTQQGRGTYVFDPGEVDRPPAMLTREEQLKQWIIMLLEKARQMGFSTEEFQQELAQHFRTDLPPKNKQMKIRTRRKKRTLRPVWYPAWTARTANRSVHRVNPKSKKKRFVSRETT